MTTDWRLVRSVNSIGHAGRYPSFEPVEDTIMMNDPEDEGTTNNDEAEEMEKAQEDAAEEREEDGGYQ